MLFKGGLQTPLLACVYGRTGSRKTTVCLNLACNFLSQGVPVGIVGLDEPEGFYQVKMISAMTGVSHALIEDQWNTDQGREWQEMFAKKARRFTISEGYRPSFGDLSHWREMAALEGGASQVVFIDYLGLLVRDKYAGAEVQRIPRLMEELHTWTRTEGVTTVVIHQMGRADDYGGNRFKGDSPSGIESMMFGGEQAIDVAFNTWRPAKDPLGIMPAFEDARGMKADITMEEWQSRAERVLKYKDSTFLALTKNRPGTATDLYGVELISVGQSMKMISRGSGN